MSKYDQNAFESLYNDGSVGKPFQTNTSRAITEAIMRQFAKDISDSFLYGITPPNTDVIYQNQDDLVTLANIVQIIAGAGTVIGSTFGVDSTRRAIGVTGNSVTGVSDVSTATFSMTIGGVNASNMLFGLGHTFILRFRVAIGTLSNGTDRFVINLGFGDTFGTAANFTNGAYFRYSDNVNGGKYQCVTVQGSTETVSDSGITPIAGSFNVFQVQVNSTGTTVYFSIDGTIVQTHTTNIPIGAAQFVTWAHKLYKTVGVAARLTYMDWYSLQITRTAAR